MTERPVWMVGEEPPMNYLRPFSEPPPSQPVYTQAQLKKMATMGEELSRFITRLIHYNEVN